MLEDGRRAAGDAICVHDGDLAGLFEIATDEAERGKGHGRRLILSALKWARLRGAREAWLQVEADNEAGAGALSSRSASTKSIAITIAGRREPERHRASRQAPAPGRGLRAGRRRRPRAAGAAAGGQARWPACGNFPAARSSPARRRKRRSIRELHEEIGIETKIAVPGAADLRQPFLRRFPSADAALCLPPLRGHRRSRREGQVLKWVRPRQMRDYPMPPADAPLIPFLIDLL